ncbi:MAG: hypothetical protein V9H69_09155 [Anaerolineae bacterium]
MKIRMSLDSMSIVVVQVGQQSLHLRQRQKKLHGGRVHSLAGDVDGQMVALGGDGAKLHVTDGGEKGVDHAAKLGHGLRAGVIFGDHRAEVVGRPIAGGPGKNRTGALVQPKGADHHIPLQRRVFAVDHHPIGVELQIHRPRRPDRDPALPRLLQHVVIELHPAQGDGGLAGFGQVQLLAPAVQHVALDGAPAEVIGEGHIQLLLQQTGQGRGEHTGALVVVALAVKILALQDGDLQAAAKPGRQPLQGQGAGHTARAASDDDDVRLVRERAQVRAVGSLHGHRLGPHGQANRKDCEQGGKGLWKSAVG